MFLARKNIKTSRLCKKLEAKYYGPFEIKAVVGKQVYYLKLLPKIGKIHLVFHISLLEPRVEQDGITVPLPPEIINGEEE